MPDEGFEADLKVLKHAWLKALILGSHHLDAVHLARICRSPQDRGSRKSWRVTRPETRRPMVPSGMAGKRSIIKVLQVDSPDSRVSR